MKYLLTSEELVYQFQIPDFVLKTQRQIAKDFATIGVYFNDQFDLEELSYDELEADVANQILDVLKMGETTLLQLLYQIDLPQNLFLDATTKPDFATIISELIIQREAYKVYLRSKF